MVIDKETDLYYYILSRKDIIVYTYEDYKEQLRYNNKVNEGTESYTVTSKAPNKNAHTQTNNEHDKTYRTILGNKKDVAYIINEALNLTEKTKVKPEELEKYNSSFITKQLKNREADIVYKIKDRNIFFLIEHQSKPDYAMPFRIYEYKTEIMISAIDRNKLKTKDYEVPEVIPIVIYTGKANWNITRYIEQIKDNRFKNVNILKYNLIDINKYTRERLEESENFIDKIFLLEKAQNAEETIEMLKRIVPKIKEQEEQIILRTIITVILKRKIGEEKVKAIIEQIGKEEEPMLAVLEMIDEENRMIRREGRREGRKEGIRQKTEQVIKEMKKNNFSEEMIATITKVSKEEIQKIIKDC